MIKINKENLDFLRKAKKIYLVAMTLELDEGHTKWPVIYTGVGKSRMTRGVLGYIKDHPELSQHGAATPEQFRRLIESGDLPIIINIGTAGSGKLDRSDIVMCSSFIDNGDSFIRERIDFNVLPVNDGLLCASSDWFISEHNFSPAEVERMRTEYDCLDMEAYAVANVCKCFGIPFCSIKCISDGADDTVLNFDEALPGFRAQLNNFVETLD